MVRKNGFTLIELLVVIAIIGIISTISMVAFSSSRIKARDGRRLADIKQISTALELYYDSNGEYPTIITPGNTLASGTNTLMNLIPTNPTPRSDGDCANSNYKYSVTDDRKNYSLTTCLGKGTNNYTNSRIVEYNKNGFFICGDNITYEGKEHRTVQIGGQCWLRDNLNVGTMLCADSPDTDTCLETPSNVNQIEKYCYYNNETATSNGGCSEQGGLYTWYEAVNLAHGSTTVPDLPIRGICPVGWHIPSAAEFLVLATAYKGIINSCNLSTTGYGYSCIPAGDQLRQAGLCEGRTPCGESNFDLLLHGIYFTDGTYNFRDRYPYLWMANSYSSTQALDRFLSYYSNYVFTDKHDKAYGFGVRCIKD